VQHDLRLAIRLADIADSITLGMWSPNGVSSTTKADDSPVTEADVAAEHAVRAHILEARPGDGFVGEELGEIVGTTGRRWIVDGIDGTRFFAAGKLNWGTLIALERDSGIVLGVSSSPAQQQRWWATRGGGTFTSRAANGSSATRLRVSTTRTPQPDRVATLPGFDRMTVEQQQTVSRILGGPSIDQTWSHQNQVAEAALDACIWFGGDIWDHAAPSILVEEAGGRFSDHWGGTRLDTRTAIYSNGIIHDEILALLPNPWAESQTD
jgi:histidinol-phosphatase